MYTIKRVQGCGLWVWYLLTLGEYEQLLNVILYIKNRKGFPFLILQNSFKGIAARAYTASYWEMVQIHFQYLAILHGNIHFWKFLLNQKCIIDIVSKVAFFLVWQSWKEDYLLFHLNKKSLVLIFAKTQLVQAVCDGGLRKRCHSMVISVIRSCGMENHGRKAVVRNDYLHF